MKHREKYLQDYAEMARQAFETHQIREESTGRWVIMKPNEKGGWRSEYWTEIICTKGGGLYVDGDISVVVFRYGPEDPLARLAWMAEREKASDHYFREKACIGMGGKSEESILTCFEREIAIADIRAYCAEDEDGESEACKALMEIAEDINDETSQEDLARALYEAGHDLWEMADYFGVVPSGRMFYAHAALQRLHHLLVERGDYKAP
jgi:hypothetical protein